jgi:hypothetical protein
MFTAWLVLFGGSLQGHEKRGGWFVSAALLWLGYILWIGMVWTQDSDEFTISLRLTCSGRYLRVMNVFVQGQVHRQFLQPHSWTFRSCHKYLFFWILI